MKSLRRIPVVCFLLVSAGCSLGRWLRPPASTPVSPPALLTPTQRVVIPNPPYIPGNPPGHLSLDDPSIFPPFDAASSYRITLSFSFEANTLATIEAQALYAAATDEFAFTFETYGNGIPGGYEEVTFAVVDGRDYFASSDIGCLSELSQQIEYPFSHLLDPGNFLTGRAARLEGETDFRGHPVYAYRIETQNLLAEPSLLMRWDAVERGVIYLSQEDLHLRGVELAGSGSARGLTGPIDGTGAMAYQLAVEKIEETVEIQVPASCLLPATDEGFPIMDGAFERVTLPGGTNFLIDASPEEVQAYYTQVLEDQSWNLESIETDNFFSSLAFKHPDGRVWMLVISADPAGGPTSVALFDNTP